MKGKKRLSMVLFGGIRESKQVPKIEYTGKNQFDFIGFGPTEKLPKEPNLFATHINHQL